MTYPPPESLSQSYGANTWLIDRLAGDLNHEDSVLQPPYEGNCLNWCVGHILVSRNTALKLLGAEPIWGEEQLALYQTGSKPITTASEGLPFAQLLQLVKQTQEQLAEALAGFTTDSLAESATTDRGTKSIGEHVAGLNWHETFHLGQLDILRQVVLDARQMPE